MSAPNQTRERGYDPTDGMFDFFRAYTNGTLVPSNTENHHQMSTPPDSGHNFEAADAGWTPATGDYEGKHVDVRYLEGHGSTGFIRLEVFASANPGIRAKPETSFLLRRAGIAWANGQEVFPNGSTLANFGPDWREEDAGDSRHRLAATYDAARTRLRQLATAMFQDVVFEPIPAVSQQELQNNSSE